MLGSTGFPALGRGLVSVAESLLVLAWLVPLVAAAFAAGPRGRWLPPSAAVPGLVTALAVPEGASLEIPWLLLGMQLGLDGIAAILLLPSAAVWLAAALYAAGGMKLDPAAGRFRVFFLLAMAGNLWLLLAQDMGSFYLGFALMGLAAYGLVAHRRSATSRFAGRVYLAWTIGGEVALFGGLAILAAASGGLAFAGLQGLDPPGLAVALVLIGFGIKIALPGLHLWLPLTYSAAPAAGAAVLAGPMIKAGLVGLLRFLPPGQPALADWGWLLIGLGGLALVWSLVAGLLQANPKAVLAFSSMGKMGLLAAGLGIAWLVPEASPLLVSALLVYALWHLLAKGALFLGVGLLETRPVQGWVLAGLVLLALVLVGAPLTGTAEAKAALKAALPADYAWVGPWLMASAFASTLLMARFLALVTPARPIAALAPLAWAILIGFVLALPLAGVLRTPGWDDSLPILGAAALAALALAAGLRGPLRHRRAGLGRRLLWGAVGGARALDRAFDRTLVAAGHSFGGLIRAAGERGPAPGRLAWTSAGVVWLLLGVILLAAVAVGS